MDNESSIINVDCPSALESCMWGPGNWRKVQESSGDHHSFAYPASLVGVEGRIMDDKSSIQNVDCASVLQVACGAPGIGARRKFRNVLQTSTHSLTCVAAVLLSKVHV
jgi:hypothetical protein